MTRKTMKKMMATTLTMVMIGSTALGSTAVFAADGASEKVEGAEGLQASDLYRVEGIVSAQIGEHAVEITSLRGVANLDRIIALLYEKGVEIQNITSEEASLETVFLKLTGRTLRD